MAKLSDLNPSEQIKLCIYGNSGTGKTCFATSFPTPLWFCDFDGKVSSAANFWRAKDPKRLEGISYENFSGYQAQGGIRVFQKFDAMLRELETKCPFKTVVLDSLTTFTDALMQHVIQENPNTKRFNRDTPVLQDYGLLNQYFKTVMRRLLALPTNLVVVGHIKVTEDQITGETIHRPALSGQLPELLPVLFQEVYRSYTETKDGKALYLAQTRSNGKYMARTEAPSMPPIIPLDYNAIINAFKGEK